MNYTQAKTLLQRQEVSALLEQNTICTPFSLVEEIVEKLPISWEDGSLKFLDPACGRGSFLFALKDRLLRAGHSEQHIVENMLFGVDISEKNIAVTRAVLNHNKYNDNLTVDNSLTKDWNGMKFDVIVGNPPYQHGDTGTNKTLFDKFYLLASELSSQYVAFIAPTTWTMSTKKRLKSLREYLISHGLYYVQELNSFQLFGVNVDMLGYTLQNVRNIQKTYTFQKLSGEKIECSASNPAILTTNSTILSILKKTSNGDVLGAINSNLRSVGEDGTCSNEEASKHPSVNHPYKMINKVSGGCVQYAWTKSCKNVHAGKYRVAFGQLSSKTSLGVISILTDVQSTTSRAVVYVPTDTHDEATSLKTYLNSKIFRFVLPFRRPNTLNAVGALNQICRPPLDRSWTDEELYKHFNLTDEEIKLIEETVK